MQPVRKDRAISDGNPDRAPRSIVSCSRTIARVVHVESRKWLLSKALPKIYGDKHTIDGKFSVDWAVVAQEAVEKYKKKHESEAAI